MGDDMKMAMIKSRLTFVILCIMMQQSVIIAVPLPLELPADQRDYLNDSDWNGDVKQANNNKNHFTEPSDTINYADYRYVGTHNSHVYPRFFKTVRQQDQSILGQLAYGVRGLMLDTYAWDLGSPSSLVGPKDSKICLSHPKPGALAFTQKGTTTYQSFKYELRRVVEFMKANPKAVITIIFENYSDNAGLAQEIKDVMAKAKYDPIFKVSDLVGGNWPTLGEMRSKNKRLVMFTQRGANTDVTFSQFNYMVENKYSTTDENELCNLRGESKNDKLLVVFNNFSGLAVTIATYTTRDRLEYRVVKRITTNCQAKKFANGRLFNGYWADRIIDSCNDLYSNTSDKSIFDYVNELNAKPDKTKP
jgi:hypothetical protein